MKTRVGDEIGVMRKGSIFGEAAADGVVSVFFIPPLGFFRGAYLALYSRLPLFIVTSFRPAGFLLSSCFVSARDQRLGPLPEFDGHGTGRSSRLRPPACGRSSASFAVSGPGRHREASAPPAATPGDETGAAARFFALR